MRDIVSFPVCCFGQVRCAGLNADFVSVNSNIPMPNTADRDEKGRWHSNRAQLMGCVLLKRTRRGRRRGARSRQDLAAGSLWAFRHRC